MDRKSNTQIKLDCLVVTYNSEKYVKQLLKKLNSYKVVNKIYVLDNFSVDNTVKLLSENKYKKVSVICSQKNIGFGSGINRLAKLSHAEYILMINPDTFPTAKAIESVLMTALKYNADITGGILYSESGQVQTSYTRVPNAFTVAFEFTNLKKIFPNNRWHREFTYQDWHADTDEIEVGTVSGGFMLVKKLSFSKIGGFDSKYFMYLEDVDLCKSAHDLKMKVMCNLRSKVTHVGGASSKNKHRINYLSWDGARLHYIKKNFNCYLATVLLFLVHLDILFTKHKRDLHVH